MAIYVENPKMEHNSLNSNLDGKCSFRIVNVNENLDLNSLNNISCALVGANLLNAPESSMSFFSVFTITAGHAGTQIAIDINGMKIYYRILASNTWFPWVKLLQ